MTTNSPPEFLRLLAHDLRWQLLSLLGHSDYRVHELVALVDRPMNLVSYHLGKLRGFELVSERRSSADGRDVYYSLDLERTRTLLQDAGLHLHPSFWMAAGASVDVPASDEGSAPRVLFLCTRNSARSQMAEGLLRHMSDDGIHAFSAGDYPTAVHPFAVRAMREVGIDISHQQAKHKDIYDGRAFDYVITVCDFARENCPVFANEPVHIHWSIPDPVSATGDAGYAAFFAVAQDLQMRIRHLLGRIASEKQASIHTRAYRGTSL